MVTVKLCHTIALRILHPVTEHGGLSLLFGCAYSLGEQGTETIPLEDVVTQHQTYAILTNEVCTDGKGLSQTIGTGLLGIGKAYTYVTAITQQPLESRQIKGCTDNQNISDTRLHEDAHRIVNHRFVVDGHQLLAYAFRNGVKSCS